MTNKSQTGTTKQRILEPEVAEVYLLKVYRRAFNREDSLVGTIEEISGAGKGTFKNEGELLRWLVPK